MNRAWSQTLLAVVAASALLAGDDRPGREGTRSGGGTFQTDVPPYPGNVILGRPTATSVTLSVLWHTPPEQRACVVYGATPDALTTRTEPFALAPGAPREVVLAGLAPDTRYHYRVVAAADDAPLLPAGGLGTCHTARAPGAPFTFTLTADPHLDEDSRLDLYRQTLANVLADTPDFHLDLGDTFMTGKHADRDGAAAQYRAQRYWFGLIGHAAPLFLVLGNHDGETVDQRGADAADGLAVWAHQQRTRYFPNPVPDRFYTGNATPHPRAGALQNYYAWTWGDALFVVLDPYWYSGTTRGGNAPWAMTLGRAQYDWLAATLRGSAAPYKFVFIHQLLGGLDAGGRGGTEAAALYEWGGRTRAGTDEFAAQRPGWPAPIHQLLRDTGVQVVFHGHDHFFARQEADGIVYQLVPQPSHRNYRHDQAAEYGYAKGDFLPNSGHLRVHVGPDQARVEYVRAADEPLRAKGLANAAVAFAYTVSPRAAAQVTSPR